MTSRLRPVLKWIYYTLKSKWGLIHLPKQYKDEYVFFEKLRRESYSDLSFEQAKLRSKAHNIDKTLVFEEVRKKDASFQRVSDLVDKVSKIPGHDKATIRWAKDVLSEYESRFAGGPASKKPLVQFDSKAQSVLAEMIRSRRSIRSFKPDRIDAEILKKILEAGLWGPTGCNQQTIEYLILEKKDDIRMCQRFAGEGYRFVTEAPLSVVVLVDPRNYALPIQRHMAYLETGAAVQNIILTAHSYGISSCWLFWSSSGKRHSELVNRFELKPWLLPTAMICLGFPENTPRFVPYRKDLESCTHR